MKTLNLMFMLGFPLAVTAQNPIIHNQFAADPTARVFNNRVYVYPSHDIVPPEGARQDWFCMGDYHVFSSENLTDWVDHGVILDQKDVQWGNPTGFSMWAPDCVEKNGTYYFYFPKGSRIGRGFAIGVATAKSPEGPFTCEPEPIKGISGIDPCVLMDNDGQSYIYWSGMGIRGAKLKSNMKEVDGELQTMTMPQRPGGNAPEGAAPRTFTVAGQSMEGLPDGFKEGPFVFRRGDWYYLTFPWVRGDTSNGANPTETLAYAMSKNPLGPWDFKGIIMAEHANHCWTNHHSIIEYKGQWYLFYHHNDFSPRDDKRRSPCIDKIICGHPQLLPWLLCFLAFQDIMVALWRCGFQRFKCRRLPVCQCQGQCQHRAVAPRGRSQRQDYRTCPHHRCQPDGQLPPRHERALAHADRPLAVHTEGCS